MPIVNLGQTIETNGDSEVECRQPRGDLDIDQRGIGGQGPVHLLIGHPLYQTFHTCKVEEWFSAEQRDRGSRL